MKNINLELFFSFKKLFVTFADATDKNLQNLGFTNSSFSILKYLYNNNKVKTQELGIVAEISSGAITYLINKLINENLVTKSQDENDKRIFWIEITDHGRKTCEYLENVQIEFINKLLSNVNDEEKREFIECINSFTKKVKKEESGGKDNVKLVKRFV